LIITIIVPASVGGGAGDVRKAAGGSFIWNQMIRRQDILSLSLCPCASVVFSGRSWRFNVFNFPHRFIA